MKMGKFVKRKNPILERATEGPKPMARPIVGEAPKRPAAARVKKTIEQIKQKNTDAKLNDRQKARMERIKTNRGEEVSQMARKNMRRKNIEAARTERKTSTTQTPSKAPTDMRELLKGARDKMLKYKPSDLL